MHKSTQAGSMQAAQVHNNNDNNNSNNNSNDNDRNNYTFPVRRLGVHVLNLILRCAGACMALSLACKTLCFRAGVLSSSARYSFGHAQGVVHADTH
jgi:hypothetical protein